MNPFFLVAGVAVAVPIILHLFHRHETRRFSFPALRYLERTEREHAREIRLRQLLLLLTRVAILLLLVGAGARLIFAGLGTAHPPTAVAIVIDNSMSSGLVLGERRVLDDLKARAAETLAAASDEDRFWVIRAGEPWLPAIAGGVPEARAAIEATEASAGAGDLTGAIQRAAELLRTADVADREIHLLSDLQRTAFELPGEGPAGDIPVIVWASGEEPAANHALTEVLVGGGLPPLEGQRTEVTVSALDAPGDTARWTVRLVVDGRVRGAGTLSAGAQTTVDLPATALGWVEGYVEADPDDLRSDDRRYFAFRARRAPAVAVGGAPGVFVSEAVSVLLGSRRLRAVAPREAEVVIAQDGEGLDARGPATAALVIPPEDPALLPAVNRRLADAGIPWRYETRSASGEAELASPTSPASGGAPAGTAAGEGLPEPLRGVRASGAYELVGAGDAASPSRVRAELAGRPWAVEGTAADGRRYMLIASPVTPAATTLPVSTGMVRFIDWIASDWTGTGSTQGYEAGAYIPAPPEATHVRFPSGQLVEIDATRTVRGTSEAGTYAFVAQDTVVALAALNTPPGESRLDVLARRDFEAAIGPETDVVSDPDAWARSLYRTRVGGEAWWPFLLAAALLLLAESLLATSGNRLRRGAPRAQGVASPAPAETSGAAP
ncbi:MAG: BatA domain-containing protein [Gemmatimonadales bacterium]